MSEKNNKPSLISRWSGNASIISFSLLVILSCYYIKTIKPIYKIIALL